MTSTDRAIPDPRPQEDRRSEDWAERIEKAREARRAGRRLREGKRLTFPETLDR